jgi:uncharacterized protein YceK
MKKLLIPIAALVLSGCMSIVQRSPPVDVSLIPNDCANQQRIVRWLENQSRGEWNEQVAQVKARIWHLRYTCNPV